MIQNVSLITGFFPVALVVAALVCLGASFSWKLDVLRWQLGLGVPVTLVLVGVIVLVVQGLDLVGYPFPKSFYVWVGLAVLALVVGAVGWLRVGNWRRLVMLLSVVLTTLMALNLINSHYQYYPSVGSLFGVEAQNQVSVQELMKIRQRAAREHGGAIPSSGFTIEINIPGKKSGFNARTAQVWVPPAWVANEKARLPVVVLLAGIPGAPQDWTRASFADQTARDFAARNGGVAPLIVMPDQSGTLNNDTECVNSVRGQAETYLTVDVPQFMRTNFGARPRERGKANVVIAGLSEGGMCATMLALRHPRLYDAFADYSGLTGPTVGLRVHPRETTQTLFAGSDQAYDEHNPLWLLANRNYRGVSGWFEVGDDDSLPLLSQRELVPLAVAAGVQTCSFEVPGGAHDFDFWGRAFRDSLPWLSWKMGLTPRPALPPGVTCTP